MDYPTFSIKEIAEIKSNSKALGEFLDEVIKCTPEIIQDLPYDLRTNDWNKLNERWLAIDDKLSSIEMRMEELGEDADVDLDLYYNWRNDREEWKNFIDNFEAEDKPRLEAKRQLVKDIQKEWNRLKKNYDTDNPSDKGYNADVEIEHLDSLFKGDFYSNYLNYGDKVPPISVLQGEDVSYDKVVDRKEWAKWDTYFGDVENARANDRKRDLAFVKSELKKLNTDGKLDGLIDKLDELGQSERSVQNDAKKYVIMKGHYPILEGRYQDQGGDKPFSQSEDVIGEMAQLEKDYSILKSEFDRTYAKAEKVKQDYIDSH